MSETIASVEGEAEFVCEARVEEEESSIEENAKVGYKGSPRGVLDSSILKNPVRAS